MAAAASFTEGAGGGGGGDSLLLQAVQHYLRHLSVHAFLAHSGLLSSASGVIDADSPQGASVVRLVLQCALEAGDLPREVLTQLVSSLILWGAVTPATLASVIDSLLLQQQFGDELARVITDLVMSDALAEGCIAPPPPPLPPPPSRGAAAPGGERRAVPAWRAEVLAQALDLLHGRTPTPVTQMRSMLRDIVAVYFEGGYVNDLDVLTGSLAELNARYIHSELLRKVVQRCVDDGRPDVLEAGSCLLAALHARGLLTSEEVWEGFLRTLHTLPSLSVDSPAAPRHCACFIARALRDGLIPEGLLAPHALPGWVSVLAPPLPLNDIAHTSCAERSAHGEWHNVAIAVAPARRGVAAGGTSPPRAPHHPPVRPLGGSGRGGSGGGGSGGGGGIAGGSGVRPATPDGINGASSGYVSLPPSGETPAQAVLRHALALFASKGNRGSDSSPIWGVGGPSLAAAAASLEELRAGTPALRRAQLAAAGVGGLYPRCYLATLVWAVAAGRADTGVPPTTVAPDAAAALAHLCSSYRGGGSGASPALPSGAVVVGCRRALRRLEAALDDVAIDPGEDGYDASALSFARFLHELLERAIISSTDLRLVLEAQAPPVRWGRATRR